MKKYLLSIIILSLSYFSATAHVEHYQKYDFLDYDLFRNDKKIGQHKYIFDRNNEKLEVKSIVNFKITKLGVDLYKYNAVSSEVYKNNQFHSFTSKTKQNKKDKYVNIKVKGNNSDLIIDGSSYKGNTSNKFIVGTWWNHEIIEAKAQISAISGRIINQNVKFIGKEIIKINGKEYKALHFNFSSSDKNLPEKKKLNTDIWYEENTYLWLKASFNKQGRWEYRLKNFK